MGPHRRGRVSAALAAALVSLALGSCTATTGEPRFEAPVTSDGENFAAYVAGRFADETGDPRAADFPKRCRRLRTSSGGGRQIRSRRW